VGIAPATRLCLAVPQPVWQVRGHRGYRLLQLVYD